MATASPPFQLDTDDDAVLRGIYCRAMSIAPEDRYESSLAMAESLEAYLDGRARASQPRSRFRRRVLLAAGLIIASGVIGTIIAIVTRERSILPPNVTIRDIGNYMLPVAGAFSYSHKQEAWPLYRQGIHVGQAVDLRHIARHLMEGRQNGTLPVHATRTACVGRFVGLGATMSRIDRTGRFLRTQ